MVQINLLPAAAKQDRRRRLQIRLKLAPVIIGLVAATAAIIVGWAILGINLSGKERRLKQMDERLSSVQSTLQRLNRLKEESADLSKRLFFIKRSLKRDISWARNLNRLSNIVPSGIWLRGLTLHTRTEDNLQIYDRLDIEGSAVFLEGQEVIDLIGEFMSALKEDEVFAGEFSEITLISSQRTGSGKGKVDLMNFRLSCKFR